MSKRTIIKEFDNSGTRSDVRRRVVECFILEAPGTGRGDLVSKYDYVVKVLSDGKKVILTRPATLKNGFDFLIRVEGIDFSNGDGRCRDYPKHARLFESQEDERSLLVRVSPFDLGDSDIFQQVKADYEETRQCIMNKGFEYLTSAMGAFVQPRTKGPGHGSTSRAFYARTKFVKMILNL